MNIFSDEMILYVGLIVASVSIFFALVFCVIHTFRKRKLNEKFDIEYGKVQKIK